MKHYMRLFHGRTDPNQDMDDWGTDGPMVGPLGGLSWTYGSLKIHTADDTDMQFLSTKEVDGMILHDGIYYGDFEFTAFDGETLEKEEFKNAIPFEQFFDKKINNEN